MENRGNQIIINGSNNQLSGDIKQQIQAHKENALQDSSIKINLTQIEELIIASKLDTALEMLLKSVTEKELRKSCILALSNFKKLQKDFLGNLISDEAYTIGQNKLSNLVLNLLEEIKKQTP